jgi:serine phosphatase RsbU (regulator of sigma subunit)
VGGDTFDFSMDRDTLRLSMTDAMGHEVAAAVLATVLVGGLRNARRAGHGLARQANLANAGLGDFARRGGFVTGQVARIDLTKEIATIANAGHPSPLPLQPGDRLMFLTDGMLERNVATVDLGALLVAGADMHPREAVQNLVHAILEAAGGELKDDAAALCLDWHGGPPRERTTDSGADH